MPKKPPNHKKNATIRAQEETSKATGKVNRTELLSGVDNNSDKAHDSLHENDESEFLGESHKNYSKRKIENNWAKYEVDFRSARDDIEEELPKTADFNSLLNMSSSDQNHFQFKSEKNWEKEKKFPDIFNLNLQLLSDGLACIPFYERVGIDKNVFSSEEIKKFDALALKNYSHYKIAKKNFEGELLLHKVPEKGIVIQEQRNLTSKLYNKADIPESCGEHRKELLQTPAQHEVSVPTLPSKADELTPSAEMTNIHGQLVESLKIVNIEDVACSEQTSNEITSSSKVEEEDLEDWLDSVLDE